MHHTWEPERQIGNHCPIYETLFTAMVHDSARAL